MAKGKTKAAEKPAAPNNVLQVYRSEGENVNVATARSILAPHFRHALAAGQVNKAQFGGMEGSPGVGDYSEAIRAKGDQAAKGDLAFVSRMLAAQAVTLDNVFTEMTRRMALNMGEHMHATDIYARHAMKAQAQSRATLEALVKLHQPREQTVRHVHVNDGGQAVIADEFHHHPGGANAETAEQSHTPDLAAGSGTPLPGPNPSGDTVPLAGSLR